MALTQRTHELVEQHFANQPRHLAIDATCGNGFDTLFLAALGFDLVMGFDIQQAAIQTTQTKLATSLVTSVRLILDSHANLANHTQGPIDCVMFNLGYLPGTPKHLTTQADTSVAALAESCRLLHSNGLITIMCYPGHPSGAEEHEEILTWLNTMQLGWQIDTHLASAPKPTAPILYTIKRRTHDMA